MEILYVHSLEERGKHEPLFRLYILSCPTTTQSLRFEILSKVSVNKGKKIKKLATQSCLIIMESLLLKQNHCYCVFMLTSQTEYAQTYSAQLM